MVEAEYREALDRVIRKAHENRNFITEEQYGGIFSSVGMNDKEDALTRGYLDSIGIHFGEVDEGEYKEPEFTEADGKYLHLYLEELEALPVYTEEEIYEAKARAVADDDGEAREVLMNHYLRSVVDIAKLYIYQAVPAEDLIGEGNIGLMTALAALTTLDGPEEVEGFVGKLIMDSMDRAIYEDTDIRQRTEDMIEKINEINDKAKALSEEMKRPLTSAELSEITGTDLGEIREALRLSGNQIEGLIP